MKQKTKGVISVFLLIIFLPLYMATGLMVDYGRIKMAQATVSMSATQATESVLSYYNELLYEMYGLFALDSRNTDKIQEIFENYLEKTLLVTNLSEEQISGVVDAFNNSLNDAKIFDGYKFNIDDVSVDHTFSLAQTDITRVQILEHMKYRAPYELVKSKDGFLSKINNVLKLGDIIDANIEVRNEFDYKGFIKTQKNITGNYIEFANGVKEVYENITIDEIEDIIKKADREMDYDYDEETGDVEPSSIRINKEIVKQMVSDIEGQTYVNDKFSEIDNLIAKMDAIIKDSQSNVKAIEDLIDKEDSQEKILVYQNNIYLIKNSCGEIIRYLFEAQWLKGQFENQEKSIDDIEELANDQIDDESYIENKIFSSNYYSDLTNSIESIIEIRDYLVKDIYGEEFTKYKDNEEYLEKAEKKNKNYDGNKYLNDYPENIDGAVSEIIESSEDNAGALLDVSNDVGMDFLNVGKMFIDEISKILVTKGDGIFVDEYIMENFANVVHHVNMSPENKQDSFPKGYDEDTKTTISTFDEDKILNKGEIEYILTGNNVAKDSVMEVGLWILTLRMALNTAAIFTDSVKVTQATKVAGVYAPLLLIAWAVAESTLDLVNIQDGYKVYVFKQGSDWVFSTENAFDKIVEYGVNEATSKAMEEVTTLTSKVSGYINTGVYDAHSTINGSLQGVHDNLEVLGSINALSGYTEPLKGHVENLISENNNLKDNVFNISKLEKAANENAEIFVNEMGSNFSEELKAQINAKVPKEMGDLEQVSSSLKIKFGYGDYLRLFLLMQNEETKLGNMQKVIQVNLDDKQSGFTMEKSITNVYSEIKVSMKYLFMTKAFVKQPGVEGNRHQLRVITNQAY